MVEIRRDDVTRTIYATDNSIYQIRPTGVALPAAAAEVSQLLNDNHQAAVRQPIVARGGGTGTNGQSLTGGLIIDVKRNLNRIISIDPDNLEAVVEPGVVTAALNAELAKHGLFWAPHTSTLNRATVGGMIATDAAGKGSLIHGRAHRHVLSLEVVLADGTPWTAEPVTIEEAERRAAPTTGLPDTGARLWRSLLDLPIEQGADFGLPELARGFSGYGIDRLRHDGMIDPIALLAGAEGTLAVITGATIRLTRSPINTVLLVACYDTFESALDDAVELRESGPSAIESFDETTLERGRSSPAWPALGAVIGEHRGAVLLLEYSGDEEIDLGAAEATLAATGRSRAVRALHDPADQAAAWKVRADAVGLLAKVATGGPERSARPTAFVEDCAVPVSSMSAFIGAFRNLLNRAGVEYGMFGHADVGCVHVRPALDLTDPQHEAMVRSITNSVVELLGQHGGVLWGEHGRGFRGDSVESFLSPETIDIMRRVKLAFDPDDLLNPGKLYRPAGSNQAIVAVDEPPLRGHADRAVPVTVRRNFDSAFACNGNGLCHHYGGAEVMCPSYKVTGDPALSPRARADLLRSWLHRKALGAPVDELAAFEDDIAANLHQCLSCSACSGRCPVEVDIPEMKSRYLERYYEDRRRPPAHTVLSRFEELAMLGARSPRLARLGSGPAGRVLGLIDLPAPKPRPARRTSIRRPKLPPFQPANEGKPGNEGEPGATDDRGGGAQTVDLVIMPDVFTAGLEPTTLHRSVRLLQAMELSVAVAPFVPSGKFDHVKGKRKAFKRAAEAQNKMIESILEVGAVPVVIEPAIALLHRSEYRHILAEHRGHSVRHLAQILDQHRDRIPTAADPQHLRLLSHCTEQAMAPEVGSAWQRVLEAAGHQVTVPPVGCCGMAGIFGHEVDNQQMSRALWDLTWADQVNRGGRDNDRTENRATENRATENRATEKDATGGTDAVPVATGYSCRSQAGRFGDRPVAHPIEYLVD